MQKRSELFVIDPRISKSTFWTLVFLNEESNRFILHFQISYFSLPILPLLSGTNLSKSDHVLFRFEEVSLIKSKFLRIIENKIIFGLIV